MLVSLTNGVNYWLFTDLEKPNVMDAEPYLRIDIRTADRKRHSAPEALSKKSNQAKNCHSQDPGSEGTVHRQLVSNVVAKELNTPSHRGFCG